MFMCKWMITKNIALHDSLEFLFPLDSSIGTKKANNTRSEIVFGLFLGPRQTMFVLASVGFCCDLKQITRR